MPSERSIAGRSTSTAHEQTTLRDTNNSRKRQASEDAVQAREPKKPKKDNLGRSDKKKRKKKARKVPVIKPTSGTSTATLSSSDTPKPMSPRHDRQSVDLDVNGAEAVDNEEDEEIGDENDAPSPQASTSSSSKGKTREIDSEPNEELVRLKKEIEQLSSLVQMHENTFSQVQQNVTCQICLDAMYKPYMLAPCGHLSCHTCLVAWFNAPPPDGRPVGSIIARRKTCPHCRAVVRERPIEAWGIKSIVNNLLDSGLAKGLAPPPAPDDATGQADPWAGIFRPKPVDPDNDFYGMFEGRAATDESGPTIGMYDHEDHVHRCLDCAHEIFGGVCSSCNREYPDHPDFGFDDEEEDEPIPVWQDFLRRHEGAFRFADFNLFTDGEEDLDEDEEDFGGDFLHGYDEHDENESDYEGSFIDDGERPRHNSRGRSLDVIEVFGDSEDEDHPAPRHHHHAIIDIANDDDDEDDGDEDDDGDDDGDGPDDDDSPLPLRRPRRIVYNVESDEEEDGEGGGDDEGPVSFHDHEVDWEPSYRPNYEHHVYEEEDEDYYPGAYPGSEPDEDYHSAEEDEYRHPQDDGSLPGPARHLRLDIGYEGYEDEGEDYDEEDDYGEERYSPEPPHHYRYHSGPDYEHEEEDDDDSYY